MTTLNPDQRRALSRFRLPQEVSTTAITSGSIIHTLSRMKLVRLKPLTKELVQVQATQAGLDLLNGAS